MIKKFFSDNNPLNGHNTDFAYPAEERTEQTETDSEQYKCGSGTSLEEQYCIKEDSKLLKNAEKALSKLFKEQNRTEEAFIDSEGERGTF